MRLRYYMNILSQPLMRSLIVLAVIAWCGLLLLEQRTGLISITESMMPISVDMSVMDSHHHMHHHKAEGLNWYSLFQLFNLHWLLMLVAMMLPLLELPIRNICYKNLQKNRIGSILVFLAGYMFFWTVIGTVLSLGISLLSQVPKINGAYLSLMAFVIMLFWQATPWKQYCLNRHHFLPVIYPFGWRAFYDSFKYGVHNAYWCVGSCWAIMGLSLAVMEYGMWSMPLFTIVMFIDQTRPWQKVIWHIPFKNFIPVNRSKMLRDLNF